MQKLASLLKLLWVKKPLLSLIKFFINRGFKASVLLITIFVVLVYAAHWGGNVAYCSYLIEPELNRPAGYSRVFGECLITQPDGSKLPLSKLRGD